MRALGLLLGIITVAGLGGCSGNPCDGAGGACVDLTVTSNAALLVDSLRVTASGAFAGTMTSTHGSGTLLPVEVPILFPAATHGNVTLTIEGLDGSNKILAGGATPVTLTAGGHIAATVDIEPDEIPGDMAHPTSDLAVRQDMSHTPDLGSGLTVATACADLAHARCARLATCSTTAPTLIVRNWGDEPTCETHLDQECLEAAGAPRTTVTTTSLEKCAGAYAAQSCADRFAGLLPAGCVVPGSGSSGQGCISDWQCASTFCKLADGAACGVCATATTAGTSSCTGGSDCSDGQSCAANVCQASAELDNPCSASQPCGEELSCTSSTCETQGASSGMACDATGATAPTCDNDRGLYCSSSNKCAALATANAGQACGLLSGVRTVCVNGADCFGGNCVAAAANGAACNLTSGPLCTIPARCVTGTCTLPSPAACN